MRFEKTLLEGVWVIYPEKISDERGFFARSWCEREFHERGIDTKWVQSNISYNQKKGTLRGLHAQNSPHEEDKLIRVTRGRAFDVLVDMRKNSPSYLKWFGKELHSGNHVMLFAPKGTAHGFLTLEDDTELFYEMSEVYYPESAVGYRYDDPALNIKWPKVNEITVSERDKGFKYLAG